MKTILNIIFLLGSLAALVAQNFHGGNSDGSSSSSYNESLNIFTGGESDGSSCNTYNETLNIFTGGNSDGSSSSMYNENRNIFAGGSSDGFSNAYFDADDITYVPDNFFEQALIDLGYDVGPLDDYVPTANIRDVTYLNISFENIYNLTGIEDFSALEYLYCNRNNLTSLDLSQNIALIELECQRNFITSLDFSQNTALTTINCQINQLTSIDISQNLILDRLFCYNNLLETIDINQNGALTNLNCYNNQLTVLDVEQNPLLTSLDCSENQLSILNLMQNTALTFLDCDDNQLNTLDVTQNTLIEDLRFKSNLLTTINLSQNTVLERISCHNNQLTSLDLSLNTNLKKIYCYNNQLTSLYLNNGNNLDIITFKAENNPNLTCIEIDDAIYSTANWTNIDPQTSYSEKCESIWYDSYWNYPPEVTRNAIIRHNYDTNVYGTIIAKSLMVEVNKILFIKPNTFVKTINNLINEGTIIVTHQGSFVQENNNATVTGTGTFITKVETTPLLDQHRFTYFSSPVQNQDLNVFNGFANMNKLWRFDESVQDWYIVNPNDTMIPAVGYAIQGAPDVGQYPQIGFVSFNGAFNNGIYSYPLTFNVGGIDDDNNLIGNPYPSAIDANMLLNNNVDANAFYFWTHNSALLANGYAGDDYAIWNSSGGIASGSGSPAPSGFIASGQGFFVDAVSEGNIVFDNTMRVTDNNTDFRTSENDKIWLNLTTNDELFSQILLNFSEDATSDFDAKLDAKRFNTTNPITFYSNGLNQERFAIQALPNLTNQTIIPLGFEVTNESISNLKISIDHLENLVDVNIYLKDNLLNLMHNIKSSDYEFAIVEADMFNNRFELVFNQNALNTQDDLLNTENIIIYNHSENKIKVKTKNNTLISEFKAFDVLGKLIIDLKPNKSSFIINTNINQGTVLFIKTKLENNQILNCKFIKI